MILNPALVTVVMSGAAWVSNRRPVPAFFKFLEKIVVKMESVMKKMCLFLGLIFLVAVPLQSLSADEPRFEDYPVGEVLKSPPAPLNLSSHPKASYFRTSLQHGVNRGPNFAGHFSIVEIGCGTMCYELGIVDLKSGQVYFPFETANMGFSYRLDSGLLVVNPPEIMKGLPYENVSATWYLWGSGKLEKIYEKKISK